VGHSQNKRPRTKWLLVVKSSLTFILNHDTQNVPMCNFMFCLCKNTLYYFVALQDKLTNKCILKLHSMLFYARKSS
jgi:hypothetical protein